jgi:hypothetical protein
VTVTLDVPDFPEVVALIVAEPAATPVTTPPELTVAAAELLLDQVTVCPFITAPFWSLTVAWRVVVAPATIDADVGATVIVVTTGATAVTVMLDVPVFPELVAVIVAEPAATPVTTPLEATVAAAELLVVHVTVCPVITLPFWSFTVACSAAFAPTTIEADVGATVTVVATGGGGDELTVTLELPDCPSHVAVIVAEPAASPVTTPLALTLATPVLLDDQLMLLPVKTFPCASATAAESAIVAPTATAAGAGDTVTVATAPDIVVPWATFEGLPNTASEFRVPRKAISWKS